RPRITSIWARTILGTPRASSIVTARLNRRRSFTGDLCEGWAVGRDTRSTATILGTLAWSGAPTPRSGDGTTPRVWDANLADRANALDSPHSRDSRSQLGEFR